MGLGRNEMRESSILWERTFWLLAARMAARSQMAARRLERAHHQPGANRRLALCTRALSCCVMCVTLSLLTIHSLYTVILCAPGSPQVPLPQVLSYIYHNNSQVPYSCRGVRAVTKNPTLLFTEVYLVELYQLI